MLTFLSETEVKQLRASVTAITDLLDRAQTLQVQADTSTSKTHKHILETQATESQPKTRVSRRKGRRGVAVLNPKKVAEIKRQLLEGKQSVAKIAREFGVHVTTINCIKWGKTWKEVAPATVAVKPLEIMEIRK